MASQGQGFQGLEDSLLGVLVFAGTCVVAVIFGLVGLKDKSSRMLGVISITLPFLILFGIGAYKALFVAMVI